MSRGSVNQGRCQTTRCQPMRRHSASTSAGSGRWPLPSKRQAARSTPLVTSNSPPLRVWHWPAKSSSNAVSSSTDSGVPRERCIWAITLSSR